MRNIRSVCGLRRTTCCPSPLSGSGWCELLSQYIIYPPARVFNLPIMTAANDTIVVAFAAVTCRQFGGDLGGL